VSISFLGAPDALAVNPWNAIVVAGNCMLCSGKLSIVRLVYHPDKVDKRYKN